MPPYGTSNKWLDRSQPQTLYFANILFYVNAGLALLTMLEALTQAGIIVGLVGLYALVEIGCGLGLANEKRAGYWAAVVVAGLGALFSVLEFVVGGFASLGAIIQMLFAVALFALLVHPMSRNYVRIWFRKLKLLRR